MSGITVSTFLGVAAVMVVVSSSFAGVGDPQIMTDHPVYRGELSCSTVQRNIDEAYRVFESRYGHAPATDTEKLLAIWAWKSEHYMHAAGNMVYYGTDNPDAVQSEHLPWSGADGWMDNKDCQMNQFSFSFGLCYSVHAQMSVLVGRALGDMRRVRCPEITGHTSFEACVDGRWVLVDFTTGLMVFDDEGKPIGLDEIYARKAANDEQWFTSPKRGGKYKFHVSPFGDKLSSYTPVRWNQELFGYNAMPIVYCLRAGETFTRYLDPGLADGKTWVFWGRDYYNIMGKPKHGPYRNVTFLDDAPIGNMRRGRGKAYYGNGVFDYVVPLANGRYTEGVCDSAHIAFSNGALRGKKAGAYVTFEHVSPYIIGARSAKGGDREWKLRTEKCVDGAKVIGSAVGKMLVKVSIDGGQTWQDAGLAEGQFAIDFTDEVKGRHAYLVRFMLSQDDGLESLRMRTVTQVGRGVFPRLKDGGTEITYQASGLAALHGGPSQQLSQRLRCKDLETEGHRVYELKAPGAIRQASGAARVSGPKGTTWWIDFSIDGGETWQAGADDLQVAGKGKLWEDGRAAYVSAEMDFPKSESNSVLVRFGKGDILHGQVFATYQRACDSALTVTYGWQEGGKDRTHSHTVKPGLGSDTWTVPTDKGVKTKWVRFSSQRGPVGVPAGRR
ncbi:MAG: hypothetical protein H8E73_04545 [Planctomycetes bacterium]|nr:hypothetical protein [Planctomycetota bacterium]